MIQDGQLVKFVNGGDAARIQKVQIAVGRDATRAPRVRHDSRGMPVQVVTGADATRAPYIHPFEGLSPAGWWRMDQGVTVTGAGISQVDDLSGKARHLLDPGTTRPIYLPYSGTKYLYLPGVAGNYASTPDSVANSITGDIDIRVRVAMDDWTPAAQVCLVAKLSSGSTRSFRLSLVSGGAITLEWSEDGSTTKLASSLSLPTVSDGQYLWVRAALDVDNGSAQNVARIYTAADSSAEPSSWTQLGAAVTQAGVTSIFNSTSPVEIGAAAGGTSTLMAGKVARAIIKNGIDGTTVVDFNPADASDGASSFASSATGETWTVNTSGALPAQIVGRASALFNGTSHYLKTAAFTLNQPTCVIAVLKQVSWAVGEYAWDGNTTVSMGLLQSGTTPDLAIYAGAALTATPDIVLNTIGIVSAVYNGASSSVRTNLNAAVTGNAGTSNGGGFTLGSTAAPGSYGNFQVYETVIFPIAPSTAQLDRLVAGLMAWHGVA